MDQENQWLSIKEAVLKFNKSAQYFYNLNQRGVVETKKEGIHLMFESSSLDHWIKKSTTPTKPRIEREYQQGLVSGLKRDGVVAIVLFAKDARELLNAI